MTKQECEKRLIEKAREIKDIIEEYNPNNYYLNIGIINGNIDIHNEYWKDDEKPIKLWISDETEEEIWEE